ncbi:MAG: bifunctional phosphoribosylaminoimidazolecarboxamide formyltransferase/IMP cyclohydrolase [Candidatus Omnitrophota bacterium]|nr:MAG: bifunctional phosphoribosylaminoimidazolecarboxamide formyltransferase/IMP cyclohydrolase [Candidatus Omnitrophota bacterium]
MVKIKRALISVYDKTGLTEFVKGLKELGVEIISTGGTAEFITSQGIEARSISDLTGFPEILNGRVKTLHPKVHGALLSLRESHAHMAEARTHGIEMIDMVVVNLYPFQEAVTKLGVKIEEVLENIDIGGPSLLRSAAKNYRSVAVISNPSRYGPVLEEMKTHRALISDQTLSVLAVEAFKLTSEYDKSINAYLGSKILHPSQEEKEAEKAEEIKPVQEIHKEETPQEIPLPEKAKPEQAKPEQAHPEQAKFPEGAQPEITPEGAITIPSIFNISLKKIEDLRYGENPHQRASFYKDENSKESSVPCARQLHGRQLSFCNIMDMDAALEVVKEFDKPAASIIKHTNPCGAAVSETLTKAYTDALECDRISAYGSIVGLNRTVDINTAEAILSSGFVECIIAPGYDDAALERLKIKQNMRILEIPSFSKKRETLEYSMRKVTGGMLIQDRDLKSLDRTQLRIVTKKKPSAEEVDSLLFAWKIVKHLRSNAIVLAKDTRTVGIGTGQMSRVDSVHIATYKAGKVARGSVLASDAFFPKTDAIEIAARAGVTAIIQPGGSKADEEIIRTTDRRGLAMVFTGMRHFRH